MNKLCRTCDTVKPVEGFFKHIRMKDGLSSQCKVCHQARTSAYQASNRERSRGYAVAWRENNRDKEKARNKKYREDNPDKKAASNKKWATNNPEKVRAINKEYTQSNQDKRSAWAAKYRASKLSATPEWLTQEHQDQILAKYAERDRITQETGIEHHVDHIFPLQGENICGLHVPWNLQIITATENMQKSNSY